MMPTMKSPLDLDHIHRAGGASQAEAVRLEEVGGIKESVEDEEALSSSPAGSGSGRANSKAKKGERCEDERLRIVEDSTSGATRHDAANFLAPMAPSLVRQDRLGPPEDQLRPGAYHMRPGDASSAASSDDDEIAGLNPQPPGPPAGRRQPSSEDGTILVEANLVVEEEAPEPLETPRYWCKPPRFGWWKPPRSGRGGGLRCSW
jgi:hypothetical protein